MKLYPYLSILCFFMLLQYKVAAQGCDDVQLNNAKKKYETGNFEDVVQLLSPCLISNIDQEKREVALRLAALTYFAIDSFDIARQYVSNLLESNPNYQTSIFDPINFVNAIDDLRTINSSTFVTSVSKKAEDIKFTPGTVVVITADKIRERGYSDLEALFSDLPGFDISRTYSLLYSNVYQRGYRATNPDRTLLLVDGMEDNDLWNNSFYLGAQYSLSNIQQVEIIYGPTSTMYGPNAFVGVINIVTKDNTSNDNPLKINAETGYGTYQTKYFDMYVAGKTKDVAMTFTARRYTSALRDLSDFEDHNYSADDYDNTDYGQLLQISNRDLGQYLSHPNFSNSYSIGFNANGDSIGIPNNTAMSFARNADKSALGRELGGNPITYSNLTDNLYFNGKVQFSNFVFGGQYWRSVNGATNYRTDSYIAGANNGTQLVPIQYFLYGKYQKEAIRNKLYIQNNIQFRVTSYDDETGVASVLNYQNRGLGISALLDGTPATWVSSYLHQTSQQFRNELKVNYVPSKALDIVMGVEYRNSFIQGNYIFGAYPEWVSNRPDTLEPNSEVGTVLGNLPPGGNNFVINELGIYAQVTYRLNSWANVVAGSRYDNNKIRVNGGYGNIINPRLALVLHSNKYIFKAIYATAFQNASNWTKFSTVPGVRDLPNPSLPPEKVSNIDVSFGGEIIPNLIFDITYYDARYNGSVFSINVPYENGITTQNQAIGELTIRGVQVNSHWKYKSYKFYANYTLCSPYSDKIIDDNVSNESERIGDIASHRFNIGLNAKYFEKLNINLRGNYVGQRPSGAGTTVSTNPYGNFEPFFLLNSSISFLTPIDGLQIQGVCNNLLDLEYVDPGMRTADGVGYTSAIPQKRRNFMLKLSYDL